MRKFKDQNYNFPAFYTAAALLRMKGHVVVSPAEMDIRDGKAWWSPEDGRIVMSPDFIIKDAMQRDVQAIVSEGVEGIVMLPEWEDSEGATDELTVISIMRLRTFEYLGDGEIEEKKLQRTVNHIAIGGVA
jgi:hypothetical protein